MDFFDQKYRTEAERKDSEFGICDDGRQAYTTLDNPKEWGARVMNPKAKTIQFVPIDHHIEAHDEHNNEYSLCDGMLYVPDHSYIAFVELKEGDKSWIPKAQRQLASTLDLFAAHHDPKVWTKREAYAANRRFPKFATSHKQEMQDFRNRYKFRLFFQRDILIQ